MDENEVIEGGLAQAVAPAASTPFAPTQAALPIVKPEPSEYEKAQAAYQQQRLQLVEQQKKLIESLESRVGGPAEMMLAFAGGIGSSPFFGENLSGGVRAMSAQQAQSRQAMSDIAKMRAEMAAQQVGMAKEDIELARNKQLSGILASVLSGNAAPDVAAAAGIPAAQASAIAQMPKEYRAIILAQLQTGDVKGAISELNKYLLELTKKPEKVKEFESYIEMLPPEFRDQARRAAASLNVFGKPSEIVEARLKVYEKLRNNDITPQEAQDELARISPPTAGARPPESAAGVPAASSTVPAEPFGVPAAAQSPTSGQVNISPRAREDVEKTRQVAEIQAQAAAREQAYKKLDELLRDSEAKASSAASTISSLDRFLESSPSAAAGGLQPLFTNVKNLLSSFGISPDSLVNEQKMSAAIDQILMGKMESMGSAARGLTDRDMESMRNSLPRINTDRRAREEVARIVKKAKAFDIEDYRTQRVSESENFPDIARVRPAPRFYLDWIKRTKDFDQLKRQYSTSTTKEAKDDVMQRFDRYYGVGVARQILR